MGKTNSRPKPSDALVLFGVTGDLAHKMIIPALYAMAKQKALTVPIIGVAAPKWSLAQLCKHATDSIKLAGDGALFTREDAVEAAWKVVDPVLKTHHRVRPYKRGTWGPKEADALIATDGGWHNPLSEGARA